MFDVFRDIPLQRNEGGNVWVSVVHRPVCVLLSVQKNMYSWVHCVYGIDIDIFVHWSRA